MKITLCICTRNRPDELSHCLSAIFQGSITPYEIIVSDDSNEEAPAQTVASEFPAVIYQKGPGRGLGPNRNSCIRRSSGTHIMFIDDDVCVSPMFFEIASDIVHRSDQNLIVTGCQIDHVNDQMRKFSPHNADFWGLQRVPVHDEYRSIVINATIFPSILFSKTKFDERIWYGSEEIDIARHAVALGFKIVYHDNLCVDHYPSSANRVENGKYTEASRLYVTTKAYWAYERSPIKALVYVLLAPAQLIGSALRKGKWQESIRHLQAILLASTYIINALSKARR